MPTVQKSFRPPSMRDVARKALLSHLRGKRIGDRLPPIKQLARELNLGESNLMIAMQKLKREGVLYSRKRVGTYVAQDASGRGGAARTEKPLATKRIALLCEPTDDMIVTMCQAARESMEELGAVVTTSAVKMNNPAQWQERCEGVDLVVLFNPPSPGSWLHLKKLDGWYSSFGCPIVVVSTAWTRGGVGGFEYDLVGIDQEEAGRLAGERLRLAGHDSACFIGRHIDHETDFTLLSAARLRGFEMGFGTALKAEHCIKSLGYSLMSGGVAFQRYARLADRPRAVFASTDELAVGFWVGAAGQGLHAGVDFDLIGVDGLALGRNQAGGPLATVEIPASDMGRTAGELAAHRLLHPDSEPQTNILSSRFFEGKTIGTLNRAGNTLARE